MTNVAKDVHWHTSPTCSRILEYLECREGSWREVSQGVHATGKYTESCLRLLHKARVIRITGYRHNTQGTPTPLYRLGPGVDVRMPKPESDAARSRRVRRALAEKYGREIMRKVLYAKKNGRPRVMVDGKQVRSSSHSDRLSGTISRKA